mgnify:CR=1 FL=1
MDLTDALASRRSVRDYRRDPVDDAVLDEVLAAATRAPSAGFAQGLDLVVLDTAPSVARYWDTTLPEGPRRDRFRWPGLLRAPVLVVVVTDPGAYVRRYGEPDKAGTGLGGSPDAWPVPYWWVDAGAAVMALLLAATAAGLGSLLFGLFDHEAAVAEVLGIPPGRRAVGTVALGHAAEGRGPTGRSAGRPRRSLGEVVHRDRW